MSKTSLVIIIYIIGLVFGALFLDIWSANTNVLKGLLGLGWTALLLIGLFFVEKNERN
jgi:ABC-type thiamin/hydroxymethylpyrimidine transport system permease subunit